MKWRNASRSGTSGQVNPVHTPFKKPAFELHCRINSLLVSINSGVSTFLKTIAGETKGLYLDTEAKFNYQGLSLC